MDPRVTVRAQWPVGARGNPRVNRFSEQVGINFMLKLNNTFNFAILHTYN
jgi:hypothetical protein